MGRGMAVFANASMALALSAHTPQVQHSVYDVSASGAQNQVKTRLVGT